MSKREDNSCNVTTAAREKERGVCTKSDKGHGGVRARGQPNAGDGVFAARARPQLGPPQTPSMRAPPKQALPMPPPSTARRRVTPPPPQQLSWVGGPSACPCARGGGATASPPAQSVGRPQSASGGARQKGQPVVAETGAAAGPVGRPWPRPSNEPKKKRIEHGVTNRRAVRHHEPAPGAAARRFGRSRVFSAPFHPASPPNPLPATTPTIPLGQSTGGDKHEAEQQNLDGGRSSTAGWRGWNGGGRRLPTQAPPSVQRGGGGSEPGAFPSPPANIASRVDQPSRERPMRRQGQSKTCAQMQQMTSGVSML